jgi:ribosome-binding factor A
VGSHRKLRVRELLKREVGEAIRRELPVHQAGLLTVNDVFLSADLKQAKVVLGFLGNTEQQKMAVTLLASHRGRIQSLVSKAVILKNVPILRFELDDSVEKGNRVLSILEELEKDPKNP